MVALKFWADATKPKQPLLVFASGFLTETELSAPLETWTEDIIRFATEHNWNVAGVYWGSKNRMQLLSEYTGFATAPLSLVEAWQEAKSNIEPTAQKLVEWLSALKDQDIYLVGHSLGARLHLRICELMPPRSIKKMLLMAPACTEMDFDFERIRAALRAPSLCFFSTHDVVLTKLFPFAENPQSVVCASLGLLPKHLAALAITAQFSYSTFKNKALGASAHTISSFEFIDTSKLLEKPIGHLTYIKYVYQILKNHL
jgi:pimeloyl-ACP methyl ester carboxylesterase